MNMSAVFMVVTIPQDVYIGVRVGGWAGDKILDLGAIRNRAKIYVSLPWVEDDGSLIMKVPVQEPGGVYLPARASKRT